MKKKLRQYLCLFIGIFVYYVIHEGAHLLYALSIGVFKQINILGFGVQIEVNDALMSSLELGIFCLVGVLASQFVGYLLLFRKIKGGIPGKPIMAWPMPRRVISQSSTTFASRRLSTIPRP